MAGSYEKRKPFKGKKFHKDLREFKSQEIKRSLVHRARLRKNYFKLLEEDKKDQTADNQPQGEAELSYDESEDDNDDNGGSSTQLRSRAPLPPQQAPPRQQAQPQPKKKPMNFAERAKLAKQRKEIQREEKLQKVQERRRMIDKRNLEREKQRERLSQRTKSGQPVMGPKISNLLDKIRQNNN